MLQDKYGRLAIVAVFIIIAVILIMAPGMNSNKSNNEQLNFTSMPKENVSKQHDSIQTSDLNNNANQESEKSFSSPEDQMLDSWGMNTAEENTQKELEGAPSHKLMVPEQLEEEIKPSISEPEPPKKPKFKPIKVNGKCFAPPVKASHLLSSECDILNSKIGIKACPAENVNDSWAGAVRTCGGVDNMPDMDDLLAIARELYSTSSIAIPEVERNKYRAYGEFTEREIQCDNYEVPGVNYKVPIAKDYGYPNQPGFSVWGKTEINPTNALSLNFGRDTVKYTSCSARTNTDYYTICRIECEE